MNYFSKKNSIILVSLSSVFLLFGTILILCSGQFIDLTYSILSQKIFHRDFDLTKWLPTLESLFLFPIFIVVAVNALIFPKYQNKYKISLLVVVFALLGFSILYASGVASDYHVNSDLASEFILANECNLEKSVLPTGYYYGTELRTLNTELISAPIFWFTKNWTVNKTLTTFFCCLILFIVTWKLLETIEVKDNWIKLFISFIIFCPFSWQAMYIGTWGNYYLPHITLCFTYLILFIYLAYKEPKKWYQIFTKAKDTGKVDTRKYIDLDEVRNTHSNIKRLYNQFNESGQNIDDFFKDVRKLKRGSVIKNIGSTILALGVVLPSIMLADRLLKPNNKEFAVEKEIKSQLKKEKQNA